MTVFDLALLAALPIFAGVALVALRPLVGWHPREHPLIVLRVALVAAHVATITSLGFVTFYGIDGATRLIPNEGADAPIQFVGVVCLVYALTSAAVMAGVLVVVARDARRFFRRG